MPNVKANQSLALLAFIASLGFSASLFANDNLRLPYDQPQDDYIDLNDKANDQPSTQNARPGANNATRDLIEGQPRLLGNECRGLKDGEYSHAYGLYTRIYKSKGKIFITYPVFTLAPQAAQPAIADRRDDRSQMHLQYEQQQQQQQQQSVDLYAQFRNQGQPTFGQYNPMNQGQIPGNMPMQAPGNMVPVQVMQNVFFPAMQTFDQWGRPTIIPEHYEQQVVMIWVTPQQAAAQGLAQQGNGGEDYRTSGRDRYRPQPPTTQTQQQPRLRESAPTQENDCVALPYLRAIELEGATSVEDGLTFINDNPREIVKEATTGRPGEPTPRSLGPVASRDPGIKSK